MIALIDKVLSWLALGCLGDESGAQRADEPLEHAPFARADGGPQQNGTEIGAAARASRRVVQ